MIPTTYTFIRYLVAKKSIDDRSLNTHVWESMARRLPPGLPDRPLRVLEIGSGIGTMLERMLERGLLSNATYTAVDAAAENTSYARARLPAWSSAHGFPITEQADNALLFSCCGPGGRGQVSFHPVTADVFEFANQHTGRRQWDLLIAHAFMDLVNLEQAMPQLMRLVRPGGMFYASLNFDGATILEPTLDLELDEQIQMLYHRSMDERMVDGQSSGDSRTGRHLFARVQQAGGQILDAGASDWVIFPVQGEYHQDEAYFLHFIIHTIHEALRDHPQLDGERFAAWIAERHNQVENRQLVYIAHQLDILGQVLR